MYPSSDRENALVAPLNERIGELEAENKRLQTERDLLLICTKHATMLIDNEANCHAQAYAIVTNLRNALVAVVNWRNVAALGEVKGG